MNHSPCRPSISAPSWSPLRLVDALDDGELPELRDRARAASAGVPSSRPGPRGWGVVAVVAPPARGAGRAGLIVGALARVFELLCGVSPSPRTRELLAQARSYEHAVKHWTTVPPSDAQAEAMFELVGELWAKSVASVRTRRARGGSVALSGDA